MDTTLVRVQELQITPYVTKTVLTLAMETSYPLSKPFVKISKLTVNESSKAINGMSMTTWK